MGCERDLGYDRLVLAFGYRWRRGLLYVMAEPAWSL